MAIERVDHLVSSFRRILQREHLLRLIDLAMLPDTPSPAIRTISSLAADELRRIDAMAAAAENAGPDPYTKAHLADARTRIAKTLDAARPEVASALAKATRIVVLQAAALGRWSPELRRKGMAILQSAVAATELEAPNADAFEVCVLSHLREVKDPLLAARAAALLPAESNVHITLAGAAPDAEWATAAQREHDGNARFTWVGELTADAAARLLASSQVLVISSRLEGGANVVGAALSPGSKILSIVKEIHNKLQEGETIAKAG